MLHHFEVERAAGGPICQSAAAQLAAPEAAVHQSERMVSHDRAEAPECMLAAADWLVLHISLRSSEELAIHQTAVAAAAMLTAAVTVEPYCVQAGLGDAGSIQMVAGPESAAAMSGSEKEKEHCW